MANYDDIEHMEGELEQAVKPYRALLQHELRSADYNAPWWHQATSSPWEYAQAHCCDHANRQPVRWVLSNGVERVTLQCIACGDKHSSGVRKADYPDFDELPDLDEELIERAREAHRVFTDRLQAIYVQAQEDFECRRIELTELERLAQNAEWWAKYNAYLRSPTWQSKRERVLERDNYLCQACLRREADQVHHLTYERVFDEPLFDLRAVCTPCHHHLHPHMRNGQ